MRHRRLNITLSQNLRARADSFAVRREEDAVRNVRLTEEFARTRVVLYGERVTG